MVLPEALYVHVPFCTRICPYCSFNVTSRFDGPGLERFLSVLAREIDGLGPQGSLPLRTVYVGGGTPTVFDPDGRASLTGWSSGRSKRTPIRSIGTRRSP
jgi:coproporphyrinogen III oxidase-like Fe-S oxidoreductase